MSGRANEFEARPDLIKQRARTIIMQRIVIAFVMIFVAANLALLSYNALTGLSTRQVLLDCTEPTGKCYKEGQERTGGIIQQLIESNQLDEVATRRIVIAAAACADDPHNSTVDEIQSCVNKILQDKEEG